MGVLRTTDPVAVPKCRRVELQRGVASFICLSLLMGLVYAFQSSQLEIFKIQRQMSDVLSITLRADLVAEYLKGVRAHRQSILNRIFDHIYIVNLPSRTDKLALSLFKLEHLGITAEVWLAVDGQLPKYDALAEKLLHMPDTQLYSRGAVGLLLTWLELVRTSSGQREKDIMCAFYLCPAALCRLKML